MSRGKRQYRSAPGASFMWILRARARTPRSPIPSFRARHGPDRGSGFRLPRSPHRLQRLHTGLSGSFSSGAAHRRNPPLFAKVNPPGGGLSSTPTPKLGLGREGLMSAVCLFVGSPQEIVRSVALSFSATNRFDRLAVNGLPDRGKPKGIDGSPVSTVIVGEHPATCGLMPTLEGALDGRRMRQSSTTGSRHRGPSFAGELTYLLTGRAIMPSGGYVSSGTSSPASQGPNSSRSRMTGIRW